MRFSRALLPSAFTVLNMYCGYLALIQIMNDKFENACWLIVLAGVFDAIDGKVARRTHHASRMGVELDSLADILSFGLAPSVLIYRAYSREWIMVGALIAFVPIICAAYRLARYNLTGDVVRRRDVRGLSTPGAAVTLCSFVLFNLSVAHGVGTPKFVVPLVIVLSILMVSTVEYDRFPALTFRAGRRNNVKVLLAALSGVLILLFQGVVFFPLAISYILFGLVRWVFRHLHEEEEEETLVSYLSK